MIEISHLTKKYGTHVAVDDLNLTIEPEGLLAFIRTEWCRQINYNEHAYRISGGNRGNH